eukprot:14967_1
MWSLKWLITTFILSNAQQWQVILDHKSTSDGFFDVSLKSTGLEHEDDPEANTYSIIGLFDEYTRSQYIVDGCYYSFRLQYVDIADDSIDVIEWRQRVWITESATDLQSDRINSEDYPYFTGVGASDFPNNAYLDGNGHAASWWFSVGVYSGYTAAQGLPSIRSSSKIAKSQTLWIWKPPNGIGSEFADESFEVLLNHRNTDCGYFASTFEGIENPSDPRKNTYSIIGNLDEERRERYRGSDGKFHFKVKFGVVRPIEWKQSSWITEPSVEGLEVIDYSWYYSYFRGVKINTIKPCASYLEAGQNTLRIGTRKDNPDVAPTYLDCWWSKPTYSDPSSTTLWIERPETFDDSVYDVQFGFETGSCWSFEAVTITLYWFRNVYQCTVVTDVDATLNTEYLCDTSNEETLLCDATDRALDFGLEIDGANAGTYLPFIKEIVGGVVREYAVSSGSLQRRLFSIPLIVPPSGAAGDDYDICANFESPERYLYVVDPNELVEKQYTDLTGDDTSACSPTNETVSDPSVFGDNSEIRFGFVTGAASSEYVVRVILFWNSRRYQCYVSPLATNASYGCSSDEDVDYQQCGPSNPNDHDIRFGVQIERSDEVEISTIYVQEIDVTTAEVLLDYRANTESIVGYTDSTKVLFFGIDVTNTDDVIHGVSGAAIGAEGVTFKCNPLVKLEITACDEGTFGIDASALQMELAGDCGQSMFFWLGSDDNLPAYGLSSVFYPDSSDTGIYSQSTLCDLHSVSIASSDWHGFCIKELEVTIFRSIYTFNSSDYFGNGVVLKKACDYSYIQTVPDSPLLDSRLLSCVDNGFTVHSYSPRGIYDVDIHSCISDGSSDDSSIQLPNMVSNVYLTIMGKPPGINAYKSTSLSYLDFCSEINSTDCASLSWESNTNKIFEINVPENLADVTVVSLGNNNADDYLCVDSISIDGQSAKHISNNKIGGDSGATSLRAVFKYPVCRTTVMDMRFDYSNAYTINTPSSATISGLSCSNKNRLLPSTCSIEQGYEMSVTTGFAISSEGSYGSEYSWGSASSVTTGISRSSEFSVGGAQSDTSSQTTGTATSNEMTLGRSYGVSAEESLTVGASATVGASGFGVEASGTVSVEASVSRGWTMDSSSEYTSASETSYETGTEQSNERSWGASAGTERSQENSYESSYGAASSSSWTQGSESAYETSSTTTITCSAEMEVAPSHSVGYSLVFNSLETEIDVYTDLKLTLCSALLKPDKLQDDSDYFYIRDVPGKVHHKETSACNVIFEVAEYIENSMTCIAEQKLAISQASEYVPRCQESDTDLYDSCQCDSSKCWCVTNTGDAFSDKVQAKEDKSDEEMCVDELQCPSTSVTKPSCPEHLEEAIASGSSYLPRCDADSYDACQCALGDVSSCWCASDTGDVLGEAMQWKDARFYAQICNTLECPVQVACNVWHNHAIEAGSTYIPQCELSDDEGDDALYVGCQCDYKKPMSCWCVDEDTGFEAESRTMIHEMSDISHFCRYECDSGTDWEFRVEGNNGCDEVRQQALLSGSGYVPSCIDGASEFYEGCQCSSEACWCSNMYGIAHEVPPHAISDPDNREKFCNRECGARPPLVYDEEYGYEDSTPFKWPFDVNGVAIAVFSVMLLVVVVYGVKKGCIKQEVKYSVVPQDSEFDEEDPLKM